MKIFDLVRDEIIKYMPKEYYCHLQFVHKVACELQQDKGGDLEIIEIAAIGHDYGRIPDADNSNHAEIGSKKLNEFLLELGYPTLKAKHVARCALMHNKESDFQSIEEEIVANADQLSKVIYHEVFMLMVKKETYHERAIWGLKYLDKGFNNATFQDIKEQYQTLYKEKRNTLELVIKECPETL